MYKSKLQELCHRRSWELPEYVAVKDGPDHIPRFTATVEVQGQLFRTPDSCKSSKEAQNTAAKIAFDHFSANVAPSSPKIVAPQPPPSEVPQPQIPPVAVVSDDSPIPISPCPFSLPDPPLGLLMTKYNADTKPAEEELLKEKCDDATECPVDDKIVIGSETKDIMHVYKNLLQQYAQKENIGFPMYTSEVEGPPHARRFKSKVTVNGKVYETSEFFPTMKEAEQAAAKIACQTLSVDVIQEDKGLYKNLLQEFAQKKGLNCPSYETQSSGLPHKQIFVSTVEIGSSRFQGGEAKTRKQAETNAAKAAYYALPKGCPPTNYSMVSQNTLPTATTEILQAATCSEPTLKRAGSPPMNSVTVSSIDSCPLSANLSQNIQPTATTEKHHAAPNEDDQQSAKRAKSDHETVDVGACLHINPQSNDSSMEVSTTTESAPGLTVTGENQPNVEWKTVVYPRKSNHPVPENASVIPYSDDQWVAYRVQIDPKPTA